MINRIILNFCFQEEFRNRLTFSDANLIRLNTENKADQKIQLKADNLNNFSTDNDIYFETHLLEPNAVKKWLMFELLIKGNTLPVGTSIGVKVKATTDNYFHDGSNWVIAGISDWNTQVEINDNIETFPIATVGNKKIGFVINIQTTDKKITPELLGIKILGEFDIEFFNDLVYDSVIRLLNEQFRSESVVAFRTDSSSSSSLQLASVLDNSGYNIFDVESVYNITDDPLKLNNLHGSYVKGALKQDGFTYEYGTETFTSSIPVGKWVLVKFKFVPEISVKVSQDYFEVPSYPHITFSRITEVAKRGFIMRDTNSSSDAIKDLENGVAVQHVSPSQKSYRFNFMIHTKEVDLFTLPGALKRFFANMKSIFSYGLGLEYGMMIVDEIDTGKNESVNDSSGTSLSSGSFDILGVIFFDRPSIDVPLVTNMVINASRIT